MHTSTTGSWSRFLIHLGFASSVALMAGPAAGQDAAPRVALETSHGTVVVELNPERAPITVANFLQYVEAGWYDGTVFHRVMDGFMIQGGGFDSKMQKKITRQPIDNESKKGLSNKRGTISMARLDDPHSATSQFFVNLVDNEGLDASGGEFGYAVFGKVVEGIDVVDAISKVEVRLSQVSEAEPQETVTLIGAKVQ